MTGRKDGKAAQALLRATGERVEQHKRFHFIIKERDTQSTLTVLCREDVDGVAAHTKHAAFKFQFVACILHGRKSANNATLIQLVFFTQMQNHVVVIV